MASIRHTDNELKEISEHFFYEVQMLFGTAQTLLEDFPDLSQISSKQSVTYNALLEAFTIHVRSLLDFLYSPKRRPDDVVASDFFDDRRTWQPQKSPILESVHTDVNKRVAHLTYTRLSMSSAASNWNYIQIVDEISKVIGAFLNLVPSTRISQSLSKFNLQIISASDVEDILKTSSAHSGGVSLMLSPTEESLLSLYLKLSPTDRSKLINEAERLAKGRT